MPGYRSRDSYRGKTEEAREKQMQNLKYYDEQEKQEEREEKEREKEEERRTRVAKKRLRKGRRAKSTPPKLEDPAYKTDPIKYMEEQYYIPETLLPIVLSDFQKDILRALFYGEEKPTMALIGQTKKSGKSTLASAICSWRMFGKDPWGKEQAEEIYLAARDITQSQWIVFNKLKESIRMNPRLLLRCEEFTKDTITREQTGSTCRCVPTDISIAGVNPSLVVFDELWSYEYEHMERFFEELTTIPTRKDPLILIISYAGDDKTSLLYRLYEKGLRDDDPTFYFIWDHENRMPWQTEKYLKQQKGRLRKNTYLRLHENRWTKAEEDFITPHLYEGCVDESLVRRPKGRKLIYVGVDVGLRNDFSAVAAVYWDGADLVLTDHAVFEPEGDEALGLEDTIERVILEWNEIYDIVLVNYDWWQCERSAQELRKHGIKCEKYNQDLANLTAMSQNLYGLITGRELQLYPDDEVKEHLLNCIAESTTRGWRINKKKQKKKIDLTVALAMACMGACGDVEDEGGEMEVYAGNGWQAGYGG